MGHFITQLVSERTDCEIVAGVDLNVNAQTASYPAYASIDQVTEAADVIIDFSHPSLLTPILHYAAEKGGIPAVLCTTGYTAEQTAELTKASETQPIFYSRNMSLGINLMLELAKKAAKVLGDQFDIEIVEKHHHNKLIQIHRLRGIFILYNDFPALYYAFRHILLNSACHGG